MNAFFIRSHEKNAGLFNQNCTRKKKKSSLKRRRESLCERVTEENQKEALFLPILAMKAGTKRTSIRKHTHAHTHTHSRAHSGDDDRFIPYGTFQAPPGGSNMSMYGMKEKHTKFPVV